MTMAPHRACRNWAGDCRAYATRGLVCEPCRAMARPVVMTLAEANERCGGSEPGFAGVCENCPLLVERQEQPREHPDVMRAARAM